MIFHEAIKASNFRTLMFGIKCFIYYELLGSKSLINIAHSRK